MSKLVKLILLLSFAALLQCCQVQYKNPVSGPTANLHFDIPYNFRNSTTITKLANNSKIFTISDGDLYRGKDAEDQDKSSVKVISNKKLTLLVTFNVSNTEFCSLEDSFIPKANHEYRLTIDSTNDNCYLNIFEDNKAIVHTTG